MRSCVLLLALGVGFCIAGCKPEPPPEPPPPPLEVAFSSDRPVEQGERVRSFVSAHLEGGERGHEVYRDVALKMKRRQLEDTSSQKARVFIEYERARTMRGGNPIALPVDATSYIVGEEDGERFFVRLDRTPAREVERAYLAADYDAFSRRDVLAGFLVERGVLIEGEAIAIPSRLLSLPRGFWGSTQIDSPEGSLTLTRIDTVSGREAAFLDLTLTGSTLLEIDGRNTSVDVVLTGHTVRDVETARELELTIDGKLEVAGGVHRGQRYDFILRVRHEYPLPASPVKTPQPKTDATQSSERDAPAARDDEAEDLSGFEE